MTDPFFVLLLSAASIGIFHTALGVDHSLPFVVLAKARGWSLERTLGITLVCGLGHVLSSVTIASVGLGLGIAGSQLSFIEETRGRWAAWLLVGFGFAYALVAWWKSRTLPFEEPTQKYHAERLEGGNGDPRLGAAMSHGRLMPALFVIFFLGPCEALLPLLTASGITLDLEQSAWVTGVFCLSTILTMLALVALGFLAASTSWVTRQGSRFARHGHALSGLALVVSGVTIQVLGI